MKGRMKKRGLLFILLAGMLIISACGAASSDKSASADVMTNSNYSVAEGGLDGYQPEMSEDANTEFDAAGETVQLSEQAKIIRTCSMTLQTTEFEETVRAIQSKAAAVGGYVESSSIYAYNREAQSAELVVRIPAEELDAWLGGVGELGTVVYSSENQRNVTLEYVDMESHVSALRAEQEALLGMMEKADRMEDIIAIQSQLTSVRYEIESYESQLRVLQDMVSYSTVNLNVDEVARESSQDTSFLGEAFSRLDDTLYGMGQSARSLGIFLIGEIPLLVLLAVVIAVIVIVVRRHRKKKRRQTVNSGNGSNTVRVDENTVQVGDNPEKQK